MADYERTVLDHYQLSTAYPTEWPAEKDLSDASEDEQIAQNSRRNGVIRRSKSRYSALERAASDRRSGVPGAQKSGDGVENLVQRDEADPLGTTDSVVRILKQQGLPVQDDIRLRNRFLLSSTTFSPALFLSQVHATASTQSLLQGLDILSKSIDQKSASLKVLVESNFERFVKAKATIDNVYMEMKNRGTEPTAPPSVSRRPHSRQTSRNSFRNSSGEFRNSSGGTAPVVVPVDITKKKNALTKESEYGVLGIKTPLIEVSAKAEEVWGPALGGREKEEALKVVAAAVERNKDAYEVGSAVVDSIKRKDYEKLVEEYAKAKRIADDARRLGDRLMTTGTSPTDAEVQQLLIAARMWSDVQDQTEDFKRDVWRRLIAVQNVSGKTNTGQPDQHMELISILLELGVTDNPIWVWLLSRYDHLKNKIQATSDRSKIEIEILRRRLANSRKPTPQVVATLLRSLGRIGPDGTSGNMDSPEVIELWDRIHTFLSSMLSSQGVLGEVTEFWQTVQNFIDGKTQKTMPVGIDGSSRQHHRLSEEGTADLRKGAVELVDMIRDSISSFFAEPPIEDISALFSPLPQTPMSPNPAFASLTPTALRDPRFAYDAKNLPPPSPRLGEAFEKFAFWPPWSNSVSGVHYLSKLLVLIGSGASEMAAISPVVQYDSQALDRLRLFVGAARERCVTAICAAWNKDAENIKVLEDWRRSAETRDVTRMPANFSAFESAILTGMQRILYISEARTRSGHDNVVTPPPAKLLQMVRSQFVTTLYKALSGMVENAEKAVNKADDDWVPDTQVSRSSKTTTTSIGAGIANAGNRVSFAAITVGSVNLSRMFACY